MGARSSIFAAAILTLAASAAEAGSGAGDLVHADSYGNLVIHGSSGYKRIIVGAGYLAQRFRAPSDHYGVPDPTVVYLDGYARATPRSHCDRSLVVLHGRSYMYGLPRDAVVVPVRDCE